MPTNSVTELKISADQRKTEARLGAALERISTLEASVERLNYVVSQLRIDIEWLRAVG